MKGCKENVTYFEQFYVGCRLKTAEIFWIRGMNNSYIGYYHVMNHLKYLWFVSTNSIDLKHHMRKLMLLVFKF